MSPKKGKNGQMGLQHMENFSTVKETRVKKQAKEWEKVFANHVSEKRLISKKCRKLDSIVIAIQLPHHVI